MIMKMEDFEMFRFIIGMMIGETIGFFTAVLLTVVKRGDKM